MHFRYLKPLNSHIFTITDASDLGQEMRKLPKLHPEDVVWAPREIGKQEVFWPAEVLHLLKPTSGHSEQSNMVVEYFGDNAEQVTMRVCDALPFQHHFERLSGQLSTPAWDAAIEDACQRSEWVEQENDENSGPETEAEGETFVKEEYVHYYRPSRKGAHNITLGCRLRIRGTGHIHHKLRQYAHTEAVMVELPVHPNTWYGVQLVDGKEVKLRKSSFDVINGNDSAVSSPISSSSSLCSPSTDDTISFAGCEPPVLNLSSNDMKSQLQKNGAKVVPSFFFSWVGRRVRIIEGVMTGKTGTVVSFRGCSFIVRVDMTEASSESTDSLVKKEETEAVHMRFDQIELLAGSNPNSPLMCAQMPQMPKSRKNSKKLVGQYVIIDHGSYRGCTGFVTKGGNGYFCVQVGVTVPNMSATPEPHGNRHPLPPPPAEPFCGPTLMKRSGDLTLIEPLAKDESGDVDSEDDSFVYHTRSASPRQDVRMEKNVLVKTGRFKGQHGVVTKSGHGFYCVELPNGRQIMKRANELEFDGDVGATSADAQVELRKLRGAAAILLDLLQEGRSPKRVRDQEEANESALYKKSRTMAAATTDSGVIQALVLDQEEHAAEASWASYEEDPQDAMEDQVGKSPTNACVALIPQMAFVDNGYEVEKACFENAVPAITIC